MNNPPSSASPRDLLRFRVGKALFGMIKGAEEMKEQFAKQQKLHPTDFACISYLSGLDAPQSPKQIITELGLTSGSGTALLDRLEQAHFIRRLPNPDDRRSVLIELNREAAAAPIARHQQMQALYRQVTDGFSDEELGVVAQFLERMGAAAATRACPPQDHCLAAPIDGREPVEIGQPPLSVVR